MDLSEVDPSRCEEFQARDIYFRERAPETLVLTYAMHWPNRQRETARNLRHTPFHHALKVRDACFAEVQGWERPAWFAPNGVTPKYAYSFGRQNWFDYAQEEQKAARYGEVVGYVTAGAYGYAVGAAVGLCIVSLAEGRTDKQAIEDGDYAVMVEGQEFAANVSLTPFYDPTSKRMFA